MNGTIELPNAQEVIGYRLATGLPVPRMTDDEAELAVHAARLHARRNGLTEDDVKHLASVERGRIFNEIIRSVFAKASAA